MAYSVISKKSGKTYYLHSKEVKLAGDRKQRIFILLVISEKEMLLMHCLMATK